MWKKIGEYISENRSEIDLDEPRLDLWIDIEEDLRPKVRKNWLSRAPFLKAAAIVLFSVGFSYLGFGPHTLFEAASDEFIAENDQLENMPLMEQIVEEDEELQEVEAYYLMQVAEKQEDLKEYNLSEYSFVAQYMDELESIDEAFEDLKDELEGEGFYEHKVDALIKTYELKIRILEQLMRQIRKAENKSQSQQS